MADLPPNLDVDTLLKFLNQRGYHRTATQFSHELNNPRSGDSASGSSNSASGTSGARSSVLSGQEQTLEHFASKNAPQEGTKTYERGDHPAQGPEYQKMLADPGGYERAYEGLAKFVHESLDIHRPELLPVLLPVFVHSYLDLVATNSRQAADVFMTRFASHHLPTHSHLLTQLWSLRLPSHLTTPNSIARRWRSNKYVVRMSERALDLVLAWAQGGRIGSGMVRPGGKAGGKAANGAGGKEKTVGSWGKEATGLLTGGLGYEVGGDERGKVWSIFNEHVMFDKIAGSSYNLLNFDPSAECGLLCDLPSFSQPRTAQQRAALQQGVPNASTVSSKGNRQPDANGVQPHETLKLGPAPLDPRLEKEVMRAAREKGRGKGKERERDNATTSLGTGLEPDEDNKEGLFSTTVGGQQQQPSGSGTSGSKDGGTGTTATKRTRDEMGDENYASPAPADLPPYPPMFKAVDVAREADKIRQGKKRIRLGVEAFVDGGEEGMLKAGELGNLAGWGSTGNQEEGGKAKPSVCMFTVHDSGETLTSLKFSEDSSLMATGSSESYIRVWNLKGQPLRGMRSDFDEDEVTKPAHLKKLRERTSATSRKLIGHAGPVYSLAFDTTPGSTSPPRYLLSASQDSSVRLWSFDTWTNLVAYKGHRDPVWDVEWGPRGTYFATGSRDKTARLWATERVHPLRIFAGHYSDVDSVKFHPNGLYLATGSSDRSCRLWDIQRGLCVRLFQGHLGPVTAIAMSPDGKHLASAGSEQEINLWDLGSGRKIKTMHGHTSQIHTLAFDQDSSILASGGADCTVRVWDVKTSARTTVSSSSTSNMAAADGGGGTTTTNGVGGFMLGSELAKRKLDEEEEDALKRLGGSIVPFSSNNRNGLKRNYDLLTTLQTKRTPIFQVKFTPSNICVAGGPIVETPTTGTRGTVGTGTGR